MDIDLDEFPELSSEEESHISDNLIPPDSERMITQDEKSNSDFYKTKCVKKESEKEKNENSPFVYNRTSKRTRHIPKVYTPDGNEGSRYCFCQREDCGWYLVCSFQTTGCLIYYHSKCVGLHYLQSQHDGSLYSNCDNGESYICPICEKKNKTSAPTSCNERVREKEASNCPPKMD